MFEEIYEQDDIFLKRKIIINKHIFQTKLLADAIAKNGQPAINFEIMKRQVDAIGELASSSSSKTLILPTDITGILGGIETLMHSITKKGK